MKTIYILLASLMLTSCVTQRVCNKRFPCSQLVKDSIIEKEKVVIRDTTIEIRIPGKEIHDSIPVPFPVFRDGKLNTKKLTKKTEYSEATAQVRDNMLYLDLTQNDIKINAKITGAIKEATYWKDRYQKEIIKPPSKWKPDIWSFLAGIFVLLIALTLLAKLKK